MDDDDGQLSLEDVPHARASDPFTSHISGRAIEAKEGTTTTIRPRTGKHMALAAIARQPLTANEVVTVTGKRGLWKRVSDLKNAELIVSIGSKTDRETDRECLIWTPTLLGRRVLARLDGGDTVKL